MNHLLRGHAPISDAGSAADRRGGRERLTPALAARRLVDFSGPHGWEHSATNLGRIEPIAQAPCAGVVALPRAASSRWPRSAAPFTVTHDELRAGDRGAVDVDFEALDQARAAARGRREQGGLPRLVQGRDHRHHRGLAARREAPRGADFNDYPRPVAKAVELLLRVGVAGPYGLALGHRRATPASSRPPSTAATRCSTTCARSSSGPIVWSPGVHGAVVLSQRGGDFLFDSGQDIAVGYHHARRRGRSPLPRGVVQLPGRPRRRPRSPIAPPDRMRALLVAMLALLACARAHAAADVVLIMTDDETVRDLGHAAHARGDRRAGRDVQRLPVVAYPLCCPARATMLTGQYPHNHRCARQPQAGRQLRPARQAPHAAGRAVAERLRHGPHRQVPERLREQAVPRRPARLVELARAAADVPDVRLRAQRERHGAHVRAPAEAGQAALPDQRPAGGSRPASSAAARTRTGRSTCRWPSSRRTRRSSTASATPCGRIPTTWAASPASRCRADPRSTKVDMSDKPPWLATASRII